MKRLGNVFDRIASEENVDLALTRAARHKKSRRSVARALFRREACVHEICQILRSGKYKTASYHPKILFEPKKRTIYSLPFYPDRIIHHAIMNILEPYWDARLISDSYACRKGKGLHKGSTKCMEYVRTYKYVLQCDVSKFYQSVDHAILKNMLETQIKDKKLLQLLYSIIDSANTINGATPGKNVPIGNLLSQWFGNVYLGILDKWIKQDLRIKAYIRYCDDFILFSNDKKELNLLRDKIVSFLGDRLNLTLSKSKLFPSSQGVDFLGYRHFPKYVLLRKRTAKKVKRFARDFLAGKYKNDMKHATGIAASYHGMLSHAQTKHLRDSIRFPEILEKVGISV